MTPGLLIALRILAGAYLLFDARKRGVGSLGAVILAIAGVYLPFVVLPLYFLSKIIPIRFNVMKMGTNTPKNAARTQLCPKCGLENATSATVCGQCHNQLTL